MMRVKYKYPKKETISGIYPVYVFLCTPRCGTQWLAKNLNEVYADSATIRFEPLGNKYGLKTRRRGAKSAGNSILCHHLDYIDEQVKQRSYIEVAWQSIAWFPELYNRFGKSLRLIHLYRNPVHVAASLVTHNWYTGKVEDRFENGALDPFDDASLLRGYRNRWSKLTLFEKSLYYWTEANFRALKIHQGYPELPFYTLQFENLFKKNEGMAWKTLMEISQFMGLDYNAKMLQAIDKQYDKYRYRTTENIDWKKIYNHPQTLRLASELGYTFDSEIDLSRYRKSLFKRVIYKLKSISSRGIS